MSERRRRFDDEEPAAAAGDRARSRSRDRQPATNSAPAATPQIPIQTPQAHMPPMPMSVPVGMHGMPAMGMHGMMQTPMMGMMPGMVPPPTLSPEQMPTFEQLQLMNMRPSTPAAPSTAPKPSAATDEVDPLDAFMNDIEKEVKAKNPKKLKEDITHARESFGPSAFARLRPHGWSERLGPDSMLEDKGTR